MDTKVKSLIRGPQIKVTPNTSIEKIWKLLSRRDITLIPVVNERNVLVGVIGEDDILYYLVPDYCEYFSEFFTVSPDMDDIEERLNKEIRLTALDLMNRNIKTISPNQPIFKALAKMMANHIRVLPVVSEEKKFLGIIWEDDIMEFIFKKHESLLKKKKKK